MAPDERYTVSDDFQLLSDGLSYEFEWPYSHSTIYVVLDGGLFVDGGMGDTPFVFYKGEEANPFVFSVNAFPSGITDFTWSDEGLPAGLSVEKDSADANKATIVGTPTSLYDVSDAKIKVSATDTSGKQYYGEVVIKVTVEEPYVEIATLVENSSCIVPMATANTQSAVLNWLGDTWLPELLEGKRLHVYEEGAVIRVNANVTSPFTAAVAGTSADPDGTDGSLSFEIGKFSDNNQDFTVFTTGVCTINATAYAHTHDYETVWSSDETNHWYECSVCDDKTELAAHIYDNDCDTDCNICGRTRTVTHAYETVWSSDETNHWYECSVCGDKTGIAAHIYDNDCDTDCNICGRTRTVTHDYETVWSSDETNHWYECSVCDDKTELAAHIYDNDCDTDCNICGRTRTVTHDYETVWSSDETNHWYECSVCGDKTGIAAHIYDNDCDTDCNICGRTRTVTHDCDNVWSYDSINHWHECSVCGDEIDLAAHTPDAEATENVPKRCSVCGCVITPATGRHTLTHIPEEAATFDKDGNTEYWYCTDCGRYFSDSEGNTEIQLEATVISKLIPGLSDLHPYIVNENSNRIADANIIELKHNLVIEDRTCPGDVIYLEGNNSEIVNIFFATDGAQPFVLAKAGGNSDNVRIVDAGEESIEILREVLLPNAGVTVKPKLITLNASGSGEYKKYCGISVEFTNNSTTEKIAYCIVMLKDKEGNMREIALVTKANAVSIGNAWGRAVGWDGITNYVDENGTTSAEVRDGIVAVKETVDDKSAWFVIDNSEGVFEEGSRFYVKWLLRKNSTKEFDEYFVGIDKKYADTMNHEKVCMFIAGVTHPDGTEYTTFDSPIKFYVQLGSDWDKEDITALFISPDGNEEIFTSALTDSDALESIPKDDSSDFQVLMLDHFSVYVVFERKSQEKTPPQTGDNNNAAMVTAVLFVSGGAALTLFACGKRRAGCSINKRK